jgi:thioredoxin 1
MDITLVIIGSLFISFVGYSYYSVRRLKKKSSLPANDKIKKLNDTNFKKQISTGINVVDFWAEWCGPCNAMIPILNKVADETKGTATICKLNVDHAKKTASRYSIKSLPTMIIFKSGKEVKRIVGAQTKGQIIEQIQQIKN